MIYDYVLSLEDRNKDSVVSPSHQTIFSSEACEKAPRNNKIF